MSKITISDLAVDSKMNSFLQDLPDSEINDITGGARDVVIIIIIVRPC